jgi:hypothetical protein
MITKRAAVIVVSCAALGVWLMTGSTIPAARQAAAVSSSARTAQSSENHFGGAAVRLVDRMRPMPVPIQSRDLFRYAAEVRRPEPVAQSASTRLEPPPVSPAAPALRLVGVAEDRTAEGTERTAIISGPGTLFVVTVGETVAAHYRVTSVSPDAVELTDIEGAGTLRLGLK